MSDTLNENAKIFRLDPRKNMSYRFSTYREFPDFPKMFSKNKASIARGIDMKK